MSSDGEDTKQQLIAHAVRLMADGGIFRLTNREIIEAAGQRNASAVSYHFGSRSDLLDAIIDQFEEGLDAHRESLAPNCNEETPTGVLIDALVFSYGTYLETTEGRSYVKVIDQLRAETPEPEREMESNAYLRRILEVLGKRPAELDPLLRYERLKAMTLLLTSAVANRARAVDAGKPQGLTDAEFLASLSDMLTAMIEAPIIGRKHP